MTKICPNYENGTVTVCNTCEINGKEHKKLVELLNNKEKAAAVMKDLGISDVTLPDSTTSMARVEEQSCFDADSTINRLKESHRALIRYALSQPDKEKAIDTDEEETVTVLVPMRLKLKDFKNLVPHADTF